MPNIKFKVRINSHSSIEKSLDNFYSNHVHQGNYGWRIRNYVSAVLLHVLLHVRSYQPQPRDPGYYAHSTLPRHHHSFSYTLHFIMGNISCFGCKHKS